MERGQKVLIGLALAAVLAIIPGRLIAYADAAGWSDDGHYINSAGKMEQNSLFQVNEDYFYADESGEIARGRWVSLKAESGNIYGAEEYWYYFGADGKAFRKKNKSFKKTIHNEIYIFDEAGVMLTGLIDEDGEWIDDEIPFAAAKYYCGKDGAMYRSRWLEYDYQGEGGLDLRSSITGKDYMEYDAMWLYFDAGGKKVRSSNDGQAKQRTIDGTTYGFDENGVMMSWWDRLATGSNASVNFYSGYDGGRLLANTWVWMFPSEEMDEVDYSTEEHSWWRTNSVGKVYRDCIREVGGLKYAFDQIGRMQTGLLLFDGSQIFVAQYDVDDWESDDFIDGTVYGIENADLYLFGPDELNGGSMQHGRDISVELADGVYTFGFRANGKAYGSRNELTKSNDCYYINGLKLEARDGLRYSVVKVSEEEYRVVTASGRMVKGNKRLLWDGEDGWYIIIGGKFKTYVEDSEKPRWRNGEDGPGYYRYDRDSRTYGELLASTDSDTDDSQLPDDARLNY